MHPNAEWPSPKELAKADSIVIYADGGRGIPPFRATPEQLATQMKRGCGFVCLHYAMEIPADKGGPEFLQWMGGYFEANWSVNPALGRPNFKELPKHPISNGVKPFTTHRRVVFPHALSRGDEEVTPILSAVPPESTMSRKDGPHEGNPPCAPRWPRRSRSTSWACERAGWRPRLRLHRRPFSQRLGQRGPAQARAERHPLDRQCPGSGKGVESNVTEEDLALNLDPKGKKSSSTSQNEGGLGWLQSRF